MKFSKIFTAATIFFMLLFVPTNIYAATNNMSIFELAYKHKLYLKVGEQRQLGYNVLSCKSSKNSIVRVNKKTGKIKALKSGSSIISLQPKKGEPTAYYLIVVYDRKIQLPEPDPNRPFIIS